MNTRANTFEGNPKKLTGKQRHSKEILINEEASEDIPGESQYMSMRADTIPTKTKEMSTRSHTFEGNPKE